MGWIAICQETISKGFQVYSGSRYIGTYIYLHIKWNSTTCMSIYAMYTWILWVLYLYRHIYIYIHSLLYYVYISYELFEILWTQGNCKVRDVSTLVGWWDQFWQSTESQDLGLCFRLFLIWARWESRTKITWNDHDNTIQTIMTPNVLLMVQNSSEKTSQVCLNDMHLLSSMNKTGCFLG